MYGGGLFEETLYRGGQMEDFLVIKQNVILIEFCLLIPNIGPKILNSVVKGDLRAFEVQLS